MTRRQRSRESFRRRPPSVEPRACVLLVCEGKKTEPNYFKSLRKELRLTTVEVEVVGQGAAPKTVVKRAVDLLKAGKHDYDHVWCIFDVEQRGKNPSIHPALDQAVANGIDVALSNPCFEYWFILHFADCGKQLVGPKGVLHELAKHVPNYSKDWDIFETLWPSVDDAIGRAKAIKKSHEAAGTARHHRDPSTEVDEVVELLRNTAARPK